MANWHIFEYLRLLLRSLALGLVAVLCVFSCEFTSIPAMLDGAVRAQYYRVGETAQSRQQVLLVALDRDTAARWGKPPWSRSRIERLLHHIIAGDPLAIGLVDPSRITGGPNADQFRDVLANYDPAPYMFRVQPRPRPDLAPLEYLSPTADDHEQLLHVLERAHVPGPSTRRWPVQYTSPPSRLPTISARNVAVDSIPSHLFTGRIVIVGIDRSLTTPVSTPVGPLAPAEIVTHALTDATSGRAFRIPSRTTSFLAIMLLAVLVAVPLPRLRFRHTLVLAGACFSGVVLVDYSLFSYASLGWGATRPLLALSTVFLLHWLSIQRQASRTLEQFSHDVAAESRRNTPQEVDDDRFWNDLADLGHGYLGHEASGFLLEIPSGQWHLELRATYEIDPEALSERRRDVRRNPYRPAYLTLRTTRLKTPIVEQGDVATYVSPLVHEHRVYGLWLINLPDEHQLTNEELKSIDDLAAEMGRTVARRRQNRHHTSVLAGAKASSQHHAELIRKGMRVLHESRQWAVHALNRLPNGIIVADMWARVQFINTIMEHKIERDFPDGIPNDDLRALLARSTGGTLDEAHDLLRLALRSSEPIHVRSKLDETTGPEYLLMRLDLESDRRDVGTTRLPLLLLVAQDVDEEDEKLIWMA